MKNYFLLLTIVLIIQAGCTNKANEFVDKVWFADMRLEGFGSDDDNWISVVKDNNDYKCFVCAKFDCVEFPVNYKNEIMMGYYNSRPIELKLNDFGDLMMNGVTIPSLKNIVSGDEKNNSKMKEFVLSNEFTHMKDRGNFRPVYDIIEKYLIANNIKQEKDKKGPETNVTTANTASNSSTNNDNESIGRNALQNIIDKEAPSLLKIDRFAKTNGIKKQGSYVMEFSADLNLLKDVTTFVDGYYWKGPFFAFYQIKGRTTEYPFHFLGNIYDINNMADDPNKFELTATGSLTFEETENGLRCTGYKIFNSLATINSFKMNE